MFFLIFYPVLLQFQSMVLFWIEVYCTPGFIGFIWFGSDRSYDSAWVSVHGSVRGRRHLEGDNYLTAIKTPHAPPLLIGMCWCGSLCVCFLGGRRLVFLDNSTQMRTWQDSRLKHSLGQTAQVLEVLFLWKDYIPKRIFIVSNFILN